MTCDMQNWHFVAALTHSNVRTILITSAFNTIIFRVCLQCISRSRRFASDVGLGVAMKISKVHGP